MLHRTRREIAKETTKGTARRSRTATYLHSQM
jgi:hypothetical protein